MLFRLAPGASYPSASVPSRGEHALKSRRRRPHRRRPPQQATPLTRRHPHQEPPRRPEVDALSHDERFQPEPDHSAMIRSIGTPGRTASHRARPSTRPHRSATGTCPRDPAPEREVWRGMGTAHCAHRQHSSAERVLVSEGVTVLVYRVDGAPMLLPMLQSCFVRNSRSTGSSNSLCTGSAKAGTSSRRRTGERKRESLHTRSLPDFSRRKFTCYA